MTLRLVSRALLRAPLLPTTSRRDPRADPCFAAGLALGGEALARGLARGQADAAVQRYARRAAFRPTPHGLWAGVAMAGLGARTRVATATPRAHLSVSWARMAGLGRALLETPAGRATARLRVAPSLLRFGDEVRWLTLGERTRAEERAAALDPPLERALAAAERWRPFDEVVRAVAELTDGDEEEALALVRGMVDERLLLHDLEPPLVGPEPLAWARARLGALVGPTLDAVASHLADEATPPEARVREVARLLVALPRAPLAGEGGGSGHPLHAVLVHGLEGPATLSGEAVARAAALGPLLFRLAGALLPPAAERALDPAPGEALDAISEILGPGAIALAPLATGAFGARVEGEPPPRPRAWPVALVAYLTERLLATKGGEASLDPDALARALDAAEVDAPVPPTFELFLQPARARPGAPAGTGWLLGAHAPAGATWARFGHALGPALAEARAELDRLEREAWGDGRLLDVAFTPSAALADLAAHPPGRDAALALSGWPDAGTAAVTPDALAVIPDERAGAGAPLALRGADGLVDPTATSRLRAATAPPGWYRLLVGWSLYRQHAPWALPLAAALDLERVPRITLDGFVIAPASFRLPRATPGLPLDDATVRRWRRRAGAPRVVQVGAEDELLAVDLEAEGAAEALARAGRAEGARAYELWPPDEALVDRGGRRVEAVVMVVREPTPEERAARARAAALTPLAPPSESPPDPRWRTYKLFGAPDRAERLLAGAVAPTVRALLATGVIDRWHFLRYVDAPGRREHLRVRLRARDPGGRTRAEARLLDALAPARRAGDLVTVETTDYLPERARYGADAMDAVEALFQADSELVCALLASDDEEGDPAELLVLAYDALAGGLGLARPDRLTLARRRREAHTPALESAGPGAIRALAEELRARKPRLMTRLATPPPLFAAHRRRVAALAPLLLPARWLALLPALLHHAAVRLLGPDRAEEARGYYLWERALEGLERKGGRG